MFKTIFFISFLIISLSSFDLKNLNAENKTNKFNVLEIDKQFNRICPVLSNQIYVRLKSGHNDIDKFLNKVRDYNVSLEETLLKETQSIQNSIKTSGSMMLANKEVIKVMKFEEPLLRTYRIYYNHSIAPEQFCSVLMDRFKEVEIAEPIAVDELLGTYIPNDEKVFQQGLLNQCRIFEMWEEWKGDTSLVIGISDGGVFQEHEDLIGNIAPNWGEIPDNGIDDDGNGYVDDFMGYNLAYKLDGSPRGKTYHDDDHGTGVAGIAAASTDNSLGIAGVAFKCSFFPIKTARLYNTSITFGYESIIYAAIRGVKVLNLSWGQAKQFSHIDQSIIDYAISRDVAIVAAAGNANGSVAPYYPASYRGVMSVGNVDLTDKVASSSSLGVHLDIMAPGESTYTTTNKQGEYYLEYLGGTSFAAPVVTGVLAMVRSKYPELNPYEAIEFTRQASDRITHVNNTLQNGYLRNRVNGLKAVTVNPMSIPGIEFEDFSISVNGLQTQRIYNNDTAEITIACRNILGNANNLRFVLSMGYDLQKTITVVDSVVMRSVQRNENFILETFRVKSNKDNNSVLFFRVDIYGDNGYHDFFMFPFVPTPEMTNFGNNVLAFSVGDRGQIGFSGTRANRQGIGFIYKNYGNLVYDAGIMATARLSDSYLTATSNFSPIPPYTEFNAVKTFSEPDIHTGILQDQANNIGVEIQQVYHIPKDNFSVVAVDVTMKNNSQRIYDDMALGYFFDWDIYPNSDSNRVQLFNEAIPESFSGAAVAQIASFYSETGSPFCACAAVSDNPNYTPQAAGMDYATISSFSKMQQYASLNSGTNIQFKGIDDINMIVGMQFAGGIGPNETRSIKFYFGCAESKDELINQFQDAILGTSVTNGNHEDDFSVTVYPNPVDRIINISLSGTLMDCSLSIFDILGNKLIAFSEFTSVGALGVITKDIGWLIPGVYILKASNQREVRTVRFIKL